MKYVLSLCTLTFLFCTGAFAQQAVTMAAWEKPPTPEIQLKNTSDSANHCNKVKVLFKATSADTVFICVRENRNGVPGPWYRNTSNVRATDGDYKGLNETISYDFRIEARNPKGISYSEILTREKCR